MNVQQLRAQIAALQDATMDDDKNFQTAYDEGKFDALSAVDALLDSLQEEPVNRTPSDIKAAMQEVEEKSKAFTEAHKGENTDTILAQMRGEESVSEDLEAFAKRVSKEFAEREYEIDYIDRSALEKGYYFGCVEGAQWQKEHLWKPADGDELPDIDREVIVLYQHYPLDVDEYSVGFAHRPPEYWDGKNIGTGVVTRYYPKKYGKGGWSSPNIKYWLDLELPKMEGGEA